MNLVIVADGTFPTHPLPLAALRDADLIIACDGAAKTLLHAGFMPHCVVGDLDTLEQVIVSSSAMKVWNIALIASLLPNVACFTIEPSI